jgi:hypothetical protein
LSHGIYQVTHSALGTHIENLPGLEKEFAAYFLCLCGDRDDHQQEGGEETHISWFERFNLDNKLRLVRFTHQQI